MYYTYILQTKTSDRFYIGSTDDINRRIRQHNDPSYRLSKTTKRFKGPWELVYCENFEARSGAMAREKEIKAWKSRKMIYYLIKDKQ